MAGFNKNRSLENARKHLEKGQLDRALKELNKVLEEDPDDVAVRVQAADVLTKKGDQAKAMEMYEKVVEHYARHKETDLRAIITYQHMLRLDGNRGDIRMRLADLLAKLGRPRDAAKELFIAAEQLDAKNGDPAELEALLVRLTELDPGDAHARKRLAEVRSRRGAVNAAAAELKGLAQEMKASGRDQDLLLTLEKAAQLQPEDPEVACQLAEVYLQRGKPKLALARLQRAFNAHPRHRGVLERLLRSFDALGRPEKAAEVARAIASLGSREEITIPPLAPPRAR